MFDASSATFRTALSTIGPIDDAMVKEITSDSGTCLMIEWHSPLNERFPDELLFSLSRAILRRDLRIIKGIGAQTREKLARSGVRCLEDLVLSSRKAWRAQARFLIDLIRCRDASQLRATRRVKDLDLMFCFHPGKVAYVDIETTGLGADARVFAIAIGIVKPGEKQFTITQLFARDPSEEFAIVKRTVDILDGVECIVTFNGKAFDVPVLKGRAWYYLGEAERVFDRHHVDLVHELRRVKGLKKRACLAHYEMSILHVQRAFDVPSAMIPAIYASFVARNHGRAFGQFMKAFAGGEQSKDGSRPVISEALVNAESDMVDIFRVLHHNMVDVRSLHGLLGWALRESYVKSKNHEPTTTSRKKQR